MTLIILLLALALEHFVGIKSALKRFDWFERYLNWLESRVSHYRFWNGAGGVVLVLIGPLLVVLFVTAVLAELFYPVALLFALAVLVYSLGPDYLFPTLANYITALEEEDESQAEAIGRDLVTTATGSPDEDQLLGAVLLRANEQLFAVIFWFIILGPFGALLYRLATVLHQRQQDIHGNFSDAALHLKNILDWPAVRLFAIGNALSGNMVDAIEAWRETEAQSLAVNESVLVASGLGALNYQPTENAALSTRSDWVIALQGLLHRTLILWLAVLGLMTIAGWLA